MSAHSFYNCDCRPVGELGEPDAARSVGPVHEGLKPLLAREPFLKGMKEQHLQTLAGSAVQVQFTSGQVIVRTGDWANRFYLIGRGKVALEMESSYDEPILLQTLGPGRVVGWSWMMSPYHEQFTARALRATEAISFDVNRLRRQCQENHDLGYEMMSRLAVVMLHRIQAMRRQLLARRGKGP